MEDVQEKKMSVREAAAYLKVQCTTMLVPKSREYLDMGQVLY